MKALCTFLPQDGDFGGSAIPLLIPGQGIKIGKNGTGSSLHGLLQARILERVTIASCRDSSWTRDQTWVFCIGRQFFTTEPPRNPAKRWWVGITALQSGRVIQAFLPYASCCVFAARWPASSSAGHLSDLHAASQVGAGSPTIEVTWQEVQLQTEITFGKACDYLVQVNRSY